MRALLTAHAVNRGSRVHPKNYFEALKKIDELQHELSELRKADKSARQIVAGLAAQRVWKLRPREWLLLEELFARYPRIASMGELNDAVPSLSARERDEKIIDIWTHRIRAQNGGSSNFWPTRPKRHATG